MFVSKEDQNHQQIAEYSELQNLFSFSSSTSSSTTSMSISPDDYGYFTDSLASTTSSPLHDTMDLFSAKEYSILRNDSLGDLEHLEPVPSYQDQDLSEFGSKRTKTMHNLSPQDVAIGQFQHDECFNLECKKSSSKVYPSSHALSLGYFSSNQSKQDDIDFKSNHHLDCTQGKLAQLLTRRDTHFEPYIIPGESASLQNQYIKGGIDALVDKSHNRPYTSSGESAPSDIDLLDDRDNHFLDSTQDQFPMLASPTRSSINVKVINNEGDSTSDIDNHIPITSKNNDKSLSMIYPQREENISFGNLLPSQDKIILVDNPTSTKDIQRTKQGKWCLYSYCFIYAP